MQMITHQVDHDFKLIEEKKPKLTFVRERQCGCDKSGRVTFAFHVRRVEYEHKGGTTRQAVHLEHGPGGRVHFLDQLAGTRSVDLQVEPLLEATITARIAFDEQRGETLIADDAIVQFVRYPAGPNVERARNLLFANRVHRITCEKANFLMNNFE